MVAFGWADTHFYEFEVFEQKDLKAPKHEAAEGRPIFKITEPETDHEDSDFRSPYRDSSDITIFKVLKASKSGGRILHYVYDHDDGWRHVISCIGRTDATTHFVCLDGEGHGCAEGVGGHSGWKELLEAYDAEAPTKRQKKKISWYEKYAGNRDSDGLRGEKKWKWNKDTVNNALSELGQSSVVASSSDSTHTILLISFGKISSFDEIYWENLAKLRSRAKLIEATDVISAMAHLSKPEEKYAAVIITDPAIMKEKFAVIQNKLVSYVEAGGIVIFGFLFAAFAKFDDMDAFFEDIWSLDWTVAAYTRSELVINPRANSVLLNHPHAKLSQKYTMKAVHLSGTKVEDRAYVTKPRSANSPAIFTRYEKGFLGFIGDVNNGSETAELLLAMCMV